MSKLRSHRWPLPAGCLIVVLLLGVIVGSTWLFFEHIWWYPASCDDPVNVAGAPTARAVWVGGMDGRYVECWRSADEPACPVRCRTFLQDGRVASHGCAECVPASACDALDFSRCQNYDGFNENRLWFTNGASLIPTPDGGLEM